jgi:opacity protein-like surface antigen
MNLRRHLLSTVSVGILAIGAAGQATAADLSVKAPSMFSPAEVRSWYFEIEGGAAILSPRNADPGLIYGDPAVGRFIYNSNLATDTGLLAGARLGYQFNPLFRADVSFHYMGWNVSGLYGCASGTQNSCQQGPGNNSLNASRSGHSFVEMVNGYIDFNPFLGPHFSRLHPYVTAGVGAAQNHLDANCVSCDYGTSNGANTHNSFAWDVGVGTRIDLFQDLKFDVAYRYYDLGKFVGGYNGLTGSSQTGGDSFRGSVHTVTGGLVLPF